jgi:ABC-type uncharacterized transport system permease subunit
MNFPQAFFAILVLYLVTTLFYLLRLVIGQRVFGAMALRLMMLAAFVQTAVLAMHFLSTPEAWFSSWLEYFQIAAAGLAWMFISLCFTRKLYAGGPLFSVLIVVLCLLSLTYDNPYRIGMAQRGNGYIYIHLTAMFLTLSVLSVGFLAAILFLLAERQIKLKRFEGWLAKLPPLEAIQLVHDRALTAGFLFYTLSVLAGAGFAKVSSGHYLSGGTKQWLGVGSWLFFALFINLRNRLGLTGHKGMAVALAGYAGLFLVFWVGFS